MSERDIKVKYFVIKMNQPFDAGKLSGLIGQLTKDQRIVLGWEVAQALLDAMVEPFQ